jgi:hypothetical protein
MNGDIKTYEGKRYVEHGGIFLSIEPTPPTKRDWELFTEYTLDFYFNHTEK